MINLTETDLDLETTLCIVGAMKEMANIDNEEHPAEQEIISAFMSELEKEFGEAGTLPESVNTSLINTPEKKLLFLQCITFVALADKQIQSVETDLLNKYITEFSVDVTSDDLIRAVGSVVIARYRGISIFTDEAVSLGASFGLSEAEVMSLIADEE